MDFLRTAAVMLLHGTFPLTLPLFLGSVLLLTVGVALKIRSDALHLRFLDHRPLSWIEGTHPHLPSLRVLAAFNLCALTLLAVGLQTLRGVFPFNDPLQGLNLASLFILAAAVGTLGELRWRGAKFYAYGFILGTALAFFTLTFAVSLPGVPLLEQVIRAGVPLASALVAWRSLRSGERSLQAAAIASGVFLFWVLTYLLQ